MDGGEGALLVPLEGIVPGEGEGVDVGAVGGDGEAGLHERQGPRVGEERVAALLQGGRVREGGLLDSGAEVAHHGKVVVGRGGLALRVDGGDVEAQRAVEISSSRFLLVDREHHVRGPRRRRHRGGRGGRRRCGSGGDRRMGWGWGLRGKEIWGVESCRSGKATRGRKLWKRMLRRVEDARCLEI